MLPALCRHHPASARCLCQPHRWLWTAAAPRAGHRRHPGSSPPRDISAGRSLRRPRPAAGHLRRPLSAQRPAALAVPRAPLLPVGVPTPPSCQQLPRAQHCSQARDEPWRPQGYQRCRELVAATALVPCGQQSPWRCARPPKRQRGQHGQSTPGPAALPAALPARLAQPPHPTGTGAAGPTSAETASATRRWCDLLSRCCSLKPSSSLHAANPNPPAPSRLQMATQGTTGQQNHSFTLALSVSQQAGRGALPARACAAHALACLPAGCASGYPETPDLPLHRPAHSGAPAFNELCRALSSWPDSPEAAAHTSGRC